MRFRYLPVFLLCVCAVSGQETNQQARVLSAGQAALEDGFHQLADKHFRAFIAAETDAERKAEGVLLLAVSLQERGKYEEVLELLDLHQGLAPTRRLALAEARGRALYALERFGDALQVLREANRDDTSPHTGLKRLEARCLIRTGETEAAIALFEELDKQLAGQPDGAAVQLDWAASLIQLGKLDEAQARLQALNAGGEGVEPAMAMEAQYWLARIHAGQDEAAEAIRLFEQVAQSPEVAVATRAEAWLQLGELYGQGTNYSAGVAAFLEAENLLPQARQRAEVRLSRALLLVRSGALEEGAALLRQQIAALGEAQAGAEAMLFLARSQLEAEDYPGAEKTSQEYLEYFSDKAGRAEADLIKGWALYHQQRYPEAIIEFDKAFEGLLDPAQRREAFIKSADALFSHGQFETAREKYLTYTRDYARDPLIPQALYQAALCLVRMGELDAAERELQRIQYIYPQEEFARRSLLQVAEIRVERIQWEKAIEIYDMYLQEYREGSFVASTLLNRGIAQYRLGLFDEAQRSFEEITAKHADSDSAQRASYMRGWALYLSGAEAEALQAFENFVKTFPDSKWSEHVLFRMAEHFYNRRVYEQAQDLFNRIVEEFPEGELREKALYWAGRSAYARNEFRQAQEYFKTAVESFPKSPRAADALFWEGHTLTRLGEYATAVQIFDQIIKNHPNSYLRCLAWSRKGDSLFTMGNKQKDESRYAEAQAAFQTIVDDTACDLALKLEAGCKIAETLDKLNKPDQALERYLDVVYKYMANRDQLGSSSERWLTRAALTAAQTLEDRGEYRDAIGVYRRLKQAQVEASKEAEKRIQRIKVEQLIIF